MGNVPGFVGNVVERYVEESGGRCGQAARCLTRGFRSSGGWFTIHTCVAEGMLMVDGRRITMPGLDYVHRFHAVLIAFVRPSFGIREVDDVVTFIQPSRCRGVWYRGGI